MDNLLQYNLTSVCLKTEFSYLSVTGDDSASFLQSQFTNDVLSLESDSLDHILSGYCNPKGRLIALIRVLRVKKSYYYLILPSELVETVLKRLNMFVLRSKVKIDLPTEKSVVVGAWGKNIKVKVGKMAQFEEMLIIRDNTCPVFGERTWIIGEKNSIQKKINNLNKISQINDFNSFYWKSSEFFSGNLWVNKSNTETFIPQSINLDLNDGVSFSKGCYPGQEIVARTHYLGKVKRRLILAEINAKDIDETQTITNTAVFQKQINHKSAEQIGFVVDNSHYKLGETKNKVLLLIQCQINDLKIQSERETLNLQNNDGPELTLLDLPCSSIMFSEKKNSDS